MRKIGFVLIVTLILILSLTLVACDKNGGKEKSLCEKFQAEKIELNVAVMSDTHYLSPSLVGDYAYESFGEKMSDAKTYEIAVAIIRSALDKVSDGGYDALIITGDLCDNHAVQNHEEMSALLKTYAGEKGLKIFVVPGNHDVAPEGYYGYKYTASGKEKVESLQDTEKGIVQSFKDYYYDFGYNVAIATHGLSYVAKLGDGYRLLAIDNCSEDLSDETLAFIDEQLAAAEKAGDKVVAAQHKPINNMFGSITDILGKSHSAITANAEKLTNTLAGRVEILFSGHNHANDAVDLKSESGKTLVEAMTGSISQSANCYKNYKFTKNYVKSQTLRLEKLNADYLPNYLSAADREAVLSDFNGYATKRIGIFAKHEVDELNLVQTLEKVIFGAEEVPAAADECIKEIVAFLDKPLYGNDSIESFFKEYAVDFPESKYATVYEAAAKVGENIFYGGENQKDGVELKVVELAFVGIVAKIYASELFDNLDSIGGNIKGRAEKCDDVVKTLLKSGRIDLYKSGLINAVLKFKKINSLLSENTVLRATVAIPKSLKYTSVSQLSKTIEALISTAKGLAMLGNIDLSDCFETAVDDGGNRIYSGVLNVRTLLHDKVFLGIAKSFVVDSDVPDRDFVLSPSNGKWEKAK